ncbi:MAG TPA: hypothetical protein QGH92_01585 [Candidatus Parcubacteria bacterium]|jgi:hypothetical protein|nr:hypothetical protein [Candidatus Parcubacteria bacterium]
MKRILAAILLIGLMGVLVVPMASYAEVDCEGLTTEAACVGAEELGGTKACSWISGECVQAPTIEVMGALNRITNWAFTILIVVAAMFITFAAFEFVTASGEAEKVKAAREYVLYALVGVVVALLARGLVQLIETIVTG